ncbi:CRTAC1 family protein [Silvibacterium sp.]|uniref:CRTAC1 family protein n=1 Tax=Silvibacterium sp. TaxID=1964179 RepID=UPI0039E43681
MTRKTTRHSRRTNALHGIRLALRIVIFALMAACCGPSRARAQEPAQESARREKTSSVQLIDITASTGIHWEHLSSPAQRYIVESMSGGVAVIDYDHDGWPDLYFTGAQSVEMALAGKPARSALYRNNHDGTFTDVSEKAGVATPCWAMGAAVGDYNNDGLPDLLVTCFGGVVLYRNNGDGTFTDVTKAAGLADDKLWATGAAFGDYDKDGYADLFVSHYVDLDLKALPVFGSSKTCRYLGVEVQCGPRGLKGSPDNLYHNNHDGTFTDVSVKAGVADEQKLFGLTAIWSDFDDDGHLDLFVTNDGEQNYLYRNHGDGTFSDVAYTAGVAASEDGVEQANMGVAYGDALHSGRSVIILSHFDNEYAAAYRNDGNMSFSDISAASGIELASKGYVGWGDALVDLDNSGWLDFFLVNGHVYPQVDDAHTAARYREPKLLLRNQRDGTFRNVSQDAGPAIETPQVSRGLAVADLFNDGKQELIVENLTGPPMILRPKGGEENHWISFTLEGTKSNRLALNTRVRVTSGDLTQNGEVLSGGSYLSQSDLRLHFGLGAHARAEKVEVRWPDGAKDTLTNLDGEHFYTVREGAGVVSKKAASSSPDKLIVP